MLRGVIRILTACLEDGQLIMLTPELKRSELRKWRESRSFYCPQCKKCVQMKVGDIVVPHFAHPKNSTCIASFSEGESPQHLSGKRLLYQLLEARTKDVILEPVLKEISQRPDLLVSTNEIQIPIEFQCSTIPISLLQKRTEGFQQIGMDPIWVLHTPEKLKNIPQGVSLLQISKFQEWFIKSSPPEGEVLLTLNPQTKTFHYFSNLLYIAGRRYIGIHHVLPVRFQTFPFARPRIPTDEEISAYLKLYHSIRKEALRRRILLNRRGINDPFLKSCYEMRILPSELPYWIGVPTNGNRAFREADYDWQMQFLYFSRRKGFLIREMGSMEIQQFVNSFTDPTMEKVFACQAYIEFLCQFGLDSCRLDSLFYENEMLQLISERFLANIERN